MTTYAASLGSFQHHAPDVVESILSCPTVSKILFPAILPTSADSGIRLTSPNDFKISLVVKELYAEGLVRIPLSGERGVKFASTIYLFQDLVTPNTVSFVLTDDHFRKGFVQLDDLRMLFAEIVPIFRVEHGSVYDQETAHRPGKPKYFLGPNQKSYPLDLDWITYFGPELVEFLGQGRFVALHSCVSKYELYGGIMIVLQNEPFQEDNPVHRERQARAEIELSLDKFVP
ncbi:MAG: hypothetical protein ACREBU_11235 [Nitrososphaera sp.]